MGKSADRTLVQKTRLTASTRWLSHRRSLAVPWVLYQNIFAEGWLGGGWVGAVQGKGAQAAGRTAVLRSLTSKVHSRTCGSVKGHRVWTWPGKSDGIVVKSSTRWKGETHRIQGVSVESHSGLFMRLSCPQASWRCWFALSAGLGSLSRNYTANCFAEQNTWLAILTWNGECRRKKGF